MNKKRPNFQKKGLTLHQEEEDPLAQSIYSQMYRINNDKI